MTRAALSVLTPPPSTCIQPVIPTPQCGAFLSWVWPWSVPSPSLESSSCLSWRHAIWRVRSPFSSLLRLARCSPMPSCSFCPRFATHPYTHLSTLKLSCSIGPQNFLVHPLIRARFRLSCGLSWPPPRCLSFFSQAFLGSNKHCEQLFGFALPSLHLLGGYVRVCSVCYFFCVSAPPAAARKWLSFFWNGGFWHSLLLKQHGQHWHVALSRQELVAMHLPLHWDLGQPVFSEVGFWHSTCVPWATLKQAFTSTLLFSVVFFFSAASLTQRLPHVAQLSFCVLRIRMCVSPFPVNAPSATFELF